MPIKPTISALLSGASSLLVLFPVQQQYLRPVNTKSDIETLRADAQNIAADFNRAMEKPNVKQEKS